MDEILNFLNKCRTFHVGTVDGDGRPRVRPFGFVMEWNGKPAFCTGTVKRVYRQLQNNPFVEICAFMPGTMQWMRISGRVKFVDDVAARRKVLETMPELKEIYGSEENPELTCFFIDEGEAAIYSFVSMNKPLKVIKI
ncbi:MAG: pyridoxamine 5'-phosphate oxidase family protein [Tannerella sp.]|jgi:uncharacterized pyridoxamine 5'-phosphate oxidase family protein|nr:pyridoxamine 5'-phosphate oxidase family protein [Tannerella sp.]